MTSGFSEETFDFSGIFAQQSFSGGVEVRCNINMFLMKRMPLIKFFVYFHEMIELYDHLYKFKPLCFDISL